MVFGFTDEVKIMVFRSAAIATVSGLVLWACAVGAGASEADCRDLDMENASAIVACVEDDPGVVNLSWLRTNGTCWDDQRFVSLKSVDGLPRRPKQEATWPQPDCAVIAEVIGILRGVAPDWRACTGYAPGGGHLRSCVSAFAEAQAKGAREAAVRNLAAMDCDALSDAYERALGRVHHFHFFPDGAGRRLPPEYVRPDCATVATVRAEFEAEAGEAAAAREAERLATAEAAVQRRQDADAARAERRRAAAEAGPRKSLGRRFDEFFDASLLEMDREILEARRARPQPRGEIDAEVIRGALIDFLHRTYPENGGAEIVTNTGPATVAHVASGMQAKTRLGGGEATVDIVRTVLDVSDLNCDFDGVAQARCTARVTIGELILGLDLLEAMLIRPGDLAASLDFADRSESVRLLLVHESGTRRWRVIPLNRSDLFLEGVGTVPGRFWRAARVRNWPEAAPNGTDGTARSAFIGPPDARDTLVLFVSLGCRNCLETLDGILPETRAALQAGTLNVDLVEVPGFVHSAGTDAEEAAARSSAMLAGWAFDCVAAADPSAAVGLLAEWVAHLKAAVPGDGWIDWVYAGPGDLAPPFADTPTERVGTAIIRGFLERTGYSDEGCMTEAGNEAFLDAMGARIDRLGEGGVPKIRLNGRRETPESLVSRLAE